jgi:CubicO group peptidase (beta-lactamase class C family)
MKTNIFIALLLIIGLSATAQRKDSGSAIPGFFIHNNPGFPAKPVRTNNIFHQKAGQTDFQKDDEFNTTIDDSHNSSTFNPTWAARFQFVLDSIMSFTTAKGISLAVMVPGEGLLTVVRGILHPGTLITTEARFGIMSNTKLFIAATLAELQGYPE